MSKHLVPRSQTENEIINDEERITKGKEFFNNIKTTFDFNALSFMEKEVDMGFFNNHYFHVSDGIVVNQGCQRVHKCSCDCNHCSWGIL